MVHKSRRIAFSSLMLAIVLLALPACAGSAPTSPTVPPARPATTTAPPAAASTPAAAAAATSAAAPAPAAAAPTAALAAKIVEYNVTVFTDNSGVAAEALKVTDPGRKVAFAWWNETKGKELGIKLNAKFYDSRYDPTVIASLWPGALNDDKPIFIVGFGGADASALQQRLSSDKVPLFFGGPASGFSWLPEQWIFYAQPTPVHHVGGFLLWRQATWGQNRPIRIGQANSEQVAVGKDQVTGMQNAVQKGAFGGKVEYAGVEWIPTLATDASNAVKRMIDQKADYIQTQLPSVTANSILRALQQYKAQNTNLLLTVGTGITAVARGSSLKDLEGTYEVIGLASEIDADTEAYKIFQQYKDKTGVGSFVWETSTEWGMVNALLPLRALERVAKTLGSDKITGAAIYNAMFGGTFTAQDMLGLTGDLNYTKEAPFPIKNVKARVNTVKDGKLVLGSKEWISVPDLPKW